MHLKEFKIKMGLKCGGDSFNCHEFHDIDTQCMDMDCCERFHVEARGCTIHEQISK